MSGKQNRIYYKTIDGVKYIREDDVKSLVEQQKNIAVEEYASSHKKKIEFSKIAVTAIVGFCMLCVAANYFLAFRNATNINEAVTIQLVVTILGAGFCYFAKAGVENFVKIRRSGQNGGGGEHEN